MRDVRGPLAGYVASTHWPRDRGSRASRSGVEAQSGTGDLIQMLDLLRGTNDGWYDEVHSLRNSVGADFVSLMTAGGSTTYCGYAYIMSNVNQNFASNAFSVLKYNCVANDTFTHELGHNMGCDHERGVNATGFQAYSYSHGYRTPGDAYRTIMAYPPGTGI